MHALQNRTSEFTLNEGDRIIVAEKTRPLCRQAEFQFLRAHEQNAITVVEDTLVAILIARVRGPVECVLKRVNKVHSKRPGKGHGQFGEPNGLIEDDSLISGFIAYLHPHFRDDAHPLWILGRPMQPENTVLFGIDSASGAKITEQLRQKFPNAQVKIGQNQVEIDMETWLEFKRIPAIENTLLVDGILPSQSP